MRLCFFLFMFNTLIFSQNIYYPLSIGREWKYQEYGIYGDTGQVETKTVISFDRVHDAYKIKNFIDYKNGDPWSSYYLIKEKGEQIIFVSRTANTPESPQYNSFDDYIHMDSNLSPNSLPPIKVSIYYISDYEVLIEDNFRNKLKWVSKDTKDHFITREVIDTQTVTVRAGTFNNVVKIKQTDSLKHRSEIAIYYEYYAPDVGLIKAEFSWSGMSYRISLSRELIAYKK